MFNDILTGKASLEPMPEPMQPYREQAVLPPVRHVCIACGQAYRGPAGSAAGRCPACHVAMVEANARQSALAVHAGQEHVRRAENSHRVLRTLLIIAIGLGAALFRYGMRTQQREDAAQAAGYHSYSEYTAERDAVYPTDEYSYRIHQLAEDMCRCTDLACARNVQAQYVRYVRSGSPTDDKARESAEQDGTRLADCQAHFEASGN